MSNKILNGDVASPTRRFRMARSALTCLGNSRPAGSATGSCNCQCSFCYVLMEVLFGAQWNVLNSCRICCRCCDTTMKTCLTENVLSHLSGIRRLDGNYGLLNREKFPWHREMLWTQHKGTEKGARGTSLFDVFGGFCWSAKGSVRP